MKVKELIEKFKEFDSELEVVFNDDFRGNYYMPNTFEVSTDILTLEKKPILIVTGSLIDEEDFYYLDGEE